jgi:hypothetical protein
LALPAVVLFLVRPTKNPKSTQVAAVSFVLQALAAVQELAAVCVPVHPVPGLATEAR